MSHKKSGSQKIRVPHLRDGLIVAKVGIRATREPLSFPSQEISQ